MKRIINIFVVFTMMIVFTGTANYLVSASAKKYDCIWYGQYPQSELKSVGRIKSNLLNDNKGMDGKARLNTKEIYFGDVKFHNNSFKYNGKKYYFCTDDFYSKYYLYEPIKWIVLKREANKALLLSDKIIDKYYYYDPSDVRDGNLYPGVEKYITWENSIARSFLNNYMIESINNFSEFKALENETVLKFPDGSPDKIITDKMFLLSKDEIDYYFENNNSNAKKTLKTEFTESLSYLNDLSRYGKYFTMNDVRLNGNYNQSVFVEPLPVKVINEDGQDDTAWFWQSSGMRPAIWVDLSKIKYENAGTYYLNGTHKEVIYNNKFKDINKTKIINAKRVKKKRIKIKLRRISNAKKYEVQYSNNKKFTRVKSIKTSKRTVYIKKTKNKKNYYIRARGYNGDVYGKWSNKKVIKRKK